ncbi:T6SS immunity protein Tdi1 domain-containing protein [Brevundimonas sp.]|uniref:T6SS immunity protein Tdi1 domain-containing protein n=1 Tax=Brevundimonas sp. TaxID=1871086 RepID=UPI002D4F3ACC|nr:T6SS immunity protein Tdi1 domain-containing protein [Brevundimonas sp.]HYD27341.1 T6SS immunity protein Tdi1 domain-containing protein [Brevundimonas sp.]
MTLLEAVRDHWAWKGFDPVEVLGFNAFGNLLVRSSSDQVWRIIPEELEAFPLAETLADYETVRSHPAFERDWAMTALLDLARSALGPLSGGQSYCLKVPAVFGGAYDDSNLAIIDSVELIRSTGTTAQQIDHLPDGTKVRLRAVDQAR